MSIAECPEDPFRAVCLETLCEIAIRYVRVVALAGGVRTIANSILESQGETAETLTTAMLYLLDDRSTRKCLRDALDLEVRRVSAAVRLCCARSAWSTNYYALFLCYRDVTHGVPCAGCCVADDRRVRARRAAARGKACGEQAGRRDDAAELGGHSGAGIGPERSQGHC